MTKCNRYGCVIARAQPSELADALVYIIDHLTRQMNTPGNRIFLSKRSIRAFIVRAIMISSNNKVLDSKTSKKHVDWTYKKRDCG